MSQPSASPILMYHKVGYLVTRPEENFLNVSAASFRRQMQVMHRLGYQARTFGDIMDAAAAGRTLPHRTFAITFDDGYQCVGESAASILKEFGWTATVFVVSGCVGTTNTWDRQWGHPEVPLMDWPELRQLAAAGWEIGGHTRSHPHLGALNDAAALTEISNGKEEAEAATGRNLRTFCYPYGRFNARTPELVRAAGFAAACTMRPGLASTRHDAFLQPRVKVYGEGIAPLLFRLLIRPHLPSKRRPEG